MKPLGGNRPNSIKVKIRRPIDDADSAGHCVHAPTSVEHSPSIQLLGQHSRVLLLQGPNGPFFARLAYFLRDLGAEVWKVNFNRGDDLYYRDVGVIRFSDAMPAWESFLRELLGKMRIDAIVVFGSARRHHRIAARVAKSMGITFWVFEEGYIRPDYITLEKGGVNADSPLAGLQLGDIPAVPAAPKRRRFKHPFARMAWYSFWYFVAGLLSAKRYPQYRHHKPFGVHEAGLWMRAAYRKYKYRWQEQGLTKALLSDGHPPFFLVALQVYNDSQIRVHSPWRRIEDFIEWTIHSFAYNAPRDTILVIKHHPMDRGHTNYAAVIDECAQRFGAVGRVVYVHDAHLPSLLHRCDGVVTINSTTGLQAMYHRVPVITLGRCFYDKEGLTYQGSLDRFWNDPKPVDMAAYRRFRNYLIHTSQINSSFYADSTLGETADAKRWHKRWRVRFACVGGLVMMDSFSGRAVDMSALFSILHWASNWFVG
ncbi:capsule biosynthesis protein [Cupriavidus cauae]|uniref:Capsular biosynthesis protein n=1 Tax=Cupriavidus cauae TaxID=2608999 RepID=A0A5M8BBK9_9BURK|nr:capsular biosynthesis protein [Cupriavidus cauae]KAA6133387.1 capsular biosynthesis protein [Cupriavidus cauae]